jgi:WD40 repeat protein
MAPLTSHEGMVVSGFGGLIRVFGVDQPLGRWYTIAADRVESVAVSPGDRHLAAVTFDGALHLWDLANKPLQRADLADGSKAAALAADAKQLVTADPDGTIVCWNPNTGEPQVVRAGFSELRVLSQSGNLALAATVTPDGSRIRLLSVPTLEAVPGVNDWPVMAAAAISADDKFVAFADIEGNLTVTDITTGKVRYAERVAAEDLGSLCLTLNHDGSCLVWRERGRNELRAANTKTGERMPLPTDLSFLGSVAAWPPLGYSPDGRRIAVALENDSGVAIQDALTGEHLVHLRHTGGLTLNLAWTPDGTRVAVTTAQNTIALFDTATGEELGELDGGLAPFISSVVFSTDGQKLRAVSAGGMGQPASLWVWRGAATNDAPKSP